MKKLKNNKKTLTKNRSKKRFIIITIAIIIFIFIGMKLTKTGIFETNEYDFSRCIGPVCPRETIIYKPVIYLYPKQKQETIVNLKYRGKLIADYPDYNIFTNGWKVIAYPDGHIINQADGLEYSYIFWEGIPTNTINWNLSEGFIVKGSDIKEFLQKTLSKIGLTPKEYNEFIVYWYPRMKDNKYNLINFAGKEYSETAPLDIKPKPDSILRVFMVFKSLNEKIDIKEQKIISFERNGFSVIEWGGTELK